jgi:serine/threonine-protein kinase RsbW
LSRDERLIGLEQSGLRSSSVADGKLSLVLNNNLAAIEDGRCRMADFLSGQGIDERTAHRLEVVFEEIVSNIIRHGFTRDSPQSIHVLIARKPGAVTLCFEDDGKAFDPLSAPAPEGFSSIETAMVGGLGIPLVRKLAESVRYESPLPQTGESFLPNNRIMVSIAAP